MTGGVSGDKKPASPSSVLFMCGMNAIRSPMAEALARAIVPPTVYVASAGVRHGERDPFVDAVMEEAGLPLTKHHPKTLDELEDGYFDLIITLAPEAHHTALDVAADRAVDVVYWPTPDPSTVTGTRDTILNAYRDVRERLRVNIAQLSRRHWGQKDG